MSLEPPKGFVIIPGYFNHTAQSELIMELRRIAAQAPLYFPCMPKSGKPFSVKMTNCGELGWVADKDGYRYQKTHPVTGRTWPEIPTELIDSWNKITSYPKPPQACLINFYGEGSKLGLHKDEDEEDMEAPVLSVSLGDDCLFRIGGSKRRDSTQSVRLNSGDIVILGGPSRKYFHGVDRIYFGTSDLLENNGRINLTLRRVTM